jgi:hypothetical protein
MDGPIRCSLLMLELKEHPKIKGLIIVVGKRLNLCKFTDFSRALRSKLLQNVLTILFKQDPLFMKAYVKLQAKLIRHPLDQRCIS